MATRHLMLPYNLWNHALFEGCCLFILFSPFFLTKKKDYTALLNISVVQKNSIQAAILIWMESIARALSRLYKLEQRTANRASFARFRRGTFLARSQRLYLAHICFPRCRPHEFLILRRCNVMESDLPCPNTTICSCAGELSALARRLPEPKDGVDTAWPRISNRNVL